MISHSTGHNSSLSRPTKFLAIYNMHFGTIIKNANWTGWDWLTVVYRPAHLTMKTTAAYSWAQELASKTMNSKLNF